MSLAVVFQIGSLGDSIVSLPSLLSLRELLPGCSDYMLITGYQGSIKVHATSIFDMAWPAKQKLLYRTNGNKFQRLASVAEAFVRLRYHRPRYGVYLLPSDRSQSQVERDKSFFRAGGVRELIGFRALTEEERHTEELSKFTTESFMRFRRLWDDRAEEKFEQYSRTPLIKPPDEAKAFVKTWLANHRLQSSRALVAICPFSNAPARDLQSSTVVSLIQRLESELQVETILLGGEKDRDRVEEICQQAGSGINACGAFSPEQSAAVLCKCELAVCIDSGPLHLAGAVDTPTVSAYATINRPFHKFLPLGERHTILYQKLSCSGCELTVCPVEGHPCISRTTSDQIFAAARASLGKGYLPPRTVHGTQLLYWPVVARESMHAV